jgi:hypothetical protein
MAQGNLGVGITQTSGKTQQPELESTLQSADPVVVIMSPLAHAAILQGAKKVTKKKLSKKSSSTKSTGKRKDHH